MTSIVSFCSDTSHAYMVVISFFTVCFFVAVYFAADKYKSVLMILIANAIKLFSASLHYLEAYSSSAYSQAINSILSSFQISFILIAIFIILNLKIKILPFVFFNIINLAQGLYFTLFGVNPAIIYSMGSYIISLMTLYSIIIIAENKPNIKKVNSALLIIILIIFSLFHVLRGTLFFIFSLGLRVDLGYDDLIKFIVILAFGLFLLLDFMLIYMNYTYLINKIRKLSYTDKLTGALSRGFFIKLLEVKMAELKRTEKNLVLAILDIDDFKKVNDTYGHVVGDEVLRGFTDNLRDTIRQNDIICRYGGEEFLILMEVSSEKEASLAIKRLHASVRGNKITEHEISVTFSGGMEFLTKKDSTRDIDEIIKLIDKRLYEAKSAGKDCSV